MRKTPQQFYIGDEVTYKNLPYAFGGESFEGRKGKIMKYESFSPQSQCWVIIVSVPKEHRYTQNYRMLEKEFKEYYAIKFKKGVASSLNIPYTLFNLSDINLNFLLPYDSKAKI